MHYVYVLRSQKFPDEKYTGRTDDLKSRLKEHNAGESKHTNKFKPWNLEVYVAFSEAQTAIEFEKYLKSGSGRAFAKKHF